MIDFKRGAKTTGSKFYFNIGETALLEMELIQQMIGFHTANGYEFVIPPYLVKEEIGEFAGQLPRFADDYYKTTEGLMLIPTAETALVGLHSNEIFKENELPKKYVAFSPCFRKEAGTYGKRDKGLKRVHQFHKVELFRIEKPEDSWKVFEEMISQVKEVLLSLGVKKEHIREVELTEEDRSPVSLKTIDVEIYAPKSKEWLEISSISNTGENQSKPALTRYKRNKDGKNVKCHLLNGSGVALPRLLIYLQETKPAKETSESMVCKDCGKSGFRGGFKDIHGNQKLWCDWCQKHTRSKYIKKPSQ